MAARFDGTGWMTFGPPDWMPTPRGDAGWVLVEDERVFLPESDYEEAVERTFRASFWGEPHVAPDGSLWVPPRLGVSGVEVRSVCDHGIDGVARFDGVTKRMLPRPPRPPAATTNP